MAGLLTSVGDDKDKAAVYLADCRKLGITVLPPDVNESELNFASVGTDIRFGLGAVRNVGANVVSSLIETRTGKGRFTDFSDYLNKIEVAACNKKVTESLIKAGAFDSLKHARKGLFLVHTDAVDSVLGTKKAEAMGQFDLFGGAGDDGSDVGDPVFTIKVPDEEWDDKHKLGLEREMLGLYVSGHPLNGVAHLLTAHVDTQIPAILDGDLANDVKVKVGGILAGVERRVNKSGLPWASAQLEDLTGGVTVLFFPQTYSVFGAEIADDAVVLVSAKVRIQDDRISLIAHDLVVPDFSNAQVNRPVAVSLPTRQCTMDKGHGAQAGAGASSWHRPGAPAVDQWGSHHHPRTRPVAAGHAVPGPDGGPQGAARPGLPGRLTGVTEWDPAAAAPLCFLRVVGRPLLSFVLVGGFEEFLGVVESVDDGWSGAVGPGQSAVVGDGGGVGAVGGWRGWMVRRRSRGCRRRYS